MIATTRNSPGTASSVVTTALSSRSYYHSSAAGKDGTGRSKSAAFHEDPAGVDVVQEAGFEEAVTTEAHAASSRHSCFMLPRYEVRNADGEAFARCLEEIFDETLARSQSTFAGS
jgi:hypothetical protein